MDSPSQLLNAAGQIFAEKGYRDATIREICAKAGANVAAVNYHFGDKERLYIEAVKSARDALEADAPMPDSVEERGPEEALRVFVETLVRRILSPNVESWQHGLLVREFMNPSQACEEIMQESIRPLIERLHVIIRRIMPDDVPVHVIRKLGFSILSQCAYYRLQDRVVTMLVPSDELENHFSLAALADHIARFSLAAIRNYNSVETHA